MFIAALFAIAEIWKQPKCPPIDERIKKSHTHTHTHTHTQWNIIQPQKEQNLAICNNIHGPQGNYAKCNKSETQTI